MILVLCTPLSVVSAMPLTGIVAQCFAAGQGALFNKARNLEDLAHAETAVFDKAGVFSEEAPTDGCFVPAYAHDNPSIALYLAGGFGDMVCQKHFVEEIIRLAKTLQIDIFTPKDAEFLKWLYIDCKNVQNI